MKEDKLREIRWARVLVPIMVLVGLGVIAYFAIRGTSAPRLAGLCLSFVPILILFIRIHRPAHTWPRWLFEVRR